MAPYRDVAGWCEAMQPVRQPASTAVWPRSTAHYPMGLLELARAMVRGAALAHKRARVLGSSIQT